ncbi:amino acid permease [Enterococcus sp. 5H]|uniref:amino acid permease n=1 Tax=Enterococcus sp. 5H TaxID=1229490 RepID=UPI002302F830|nr:amino acid permease [Enterococcus sp. 5H]MDA9472934.1 putative glutamate, gamma-aminobutyrate antiporter [Enterococcus sp. 5H]
MNTNKKISSFGFFAMTAALFVTVYEYPTFADMGKSLIFFLLLSGFCFFLPVALCAAELATIEDPSYQEGGIFSWVGKVLGEKFGFAAIFFQWIQITVGFVTMLYFIIGTLSVVFNVPVINDNMYVKFLIVVLSFWLITILQFKGTQITEKIAKFGFSIGIVLSVIIMSILAIKYFSNGNHISLNYQKSDFIPNKKSWGMLTSFILGYMGVEASAPHITKLNNYSKTYPKIMIVLVFVAVGLTTLGSCIVSMVLPGNISANAGVIDAFRQLISPGKISWGVILLGLMISFGIIAQISSWIVSPTEGLRFVATKGLLPQKFTKVNKAGVPIPLLILQGIVVTIWAAVLTFSSGSSGGNMSYQIALNLTGMIYLVGYILFFISYFIIITKHKDLKRAYQLPGGKIGKVIIAGMGLLLTIGALVTAFMVPTTISSQQSSVYLITLTISFIVTIMLPFVFYKLYKKRI